jgi:hypothetical protein
MEDFRKLVKKYWKFGLLAIIAIVLLTVFSAMGGDPRQPGSSYSIAANGYSSWYQTMLDRGANIHRWQKPFTQLAKSETYSEGTTLLQVNNKLDRLHLSGNQIDWVARGNTLVVLGVTAPAWEIPFRQDLDSNLGKVRIETTRRFKQKLIDIGLPPSTPLRSILSDKSGQVITQFDLKQGRVIIATTPYLAANAFQDFRPNYQLLTQVVTDDRQQILVDEYIHGYIDRKPKASVKKDAPVDGESIADDTDKIDVLEYLFKTPFLIAVLNLLLGTIVLIWQQNRRFGKVIIPKLPEIENSEAYIQALGGVLRQANSSDFVVQNIGKTQQLSWQRKLGLGSDRLVTAPILINAWEERTKLPTDDLRYVLQLTTAERRLTPTELSIWLTKLQNVDRLLKNYDL